MKKLFFLLFYCFFSLDANNRLIVLITTYNNSKWCEKNIHSVLSQQYDNFYVIVRDDASTDNTFPRIIKEVKRLHAEEKVFLHKNARRRGKVANIWLTLHQVDIQVSIDDSDVIVMCDGDDWYPHNQVLSHINEVFANNDVWITYGGFVEFPSGRKCWNKVMPQEIIHQNKFREYGKNTSQQRCFYAGLYRQIKIEDLMVESRFAQMAGDVAKTMPMLEMAAERHHLFKESLYVYNRDNPRNDDKVNRRVQHQICKSFLMRTKYQRRDSYLSFEGEEVDLFCCCDLSFIERCKIKGFSNLIYVDKDISRSNLIDLLQKSSASYVLFLSGHENLFANVDLKCVTAYMNKTWASHFNIKKHAYIKSATSEPLGDGVFCCQVGWNKRINRDKFTGNVYARSFILSQLKNYKCATYTECVLLWEKNLFLNEKFRVVLFFNK